MKTLTLIHQEYPTSKHLFPLSSYLGSWGEIRTSHFLQLISCFTPRSHHSPYFTSQFLFASPVFVTSTGLASNLHLQKENKHRVANTRNSSAEGWDGWLVLGRFGSERERLRQPSVLC